MATQSADMRPVTHQHVTLQRNSAAATFAIMIGVVFVLKTASEIFLPFAIAVLLAFALHPVVTAFRRMGLPRILAVIAAVALAFLLVAMFSFIVTLQINELAREIPTYQNNVIEKIRSIKDMGASSGNLEGLTNVLERLGAEFNASTGAAAAADQPLLVEIFTPQKPVELLESLVVPLLGPLATAGLVVVVLIFMLIDREELRDRFIRLVGYGDLHRTTSALQDAGTRVSQYLLMQLIVNITYGVPIGVGLWLIGVPNAMLWGLLAIVLRFIPYIGPAIAAILPITLAFAIAPGWSMVLWTVALFLGIELISNNVVEPWLYGSKTGLSTIAIIVAAIFWTWMWGPIGLVLSTPLTVCLVVLGRHVPQLAFLEILLGNEQVLEPDERLYQRLLAGDPEEATFNAEAMLEDRYLVDYYGKVGIPALLMGEHDRARGALSAEQMQQIAESAGTLLENLQAIAEAESEEAEEPDTRAGDVADEEDSLETDFESLPDGEGHRVLCIGGHTMLDDVSAAMLAQVMTVQGAQTTVFGHQSAEPRNLKELDLAGYDTAVIGFLNTGSLGTARYLVQRLKRKYLNLRIGIVFWDEDAMDGEELDSVRERLHADFVAVKLADAVTQALKHEEAVPLPAIKTLRRRPTQAPKAKAKLQAETLVIA